MVPCGVEDEPVDVETRMGATISDVDAESEWIKGKTWMSLSMDELFGSYLKDVDKVKLKNEHISEIR